MSVPPGLSRETSIRVDKDGAFWHEGQRFTHQGLARAFAAWVDIDDESGRYVIRNSINWAFITVEDAPIVVHAAERGEDGRIRLLLSDGALEPLDEASLRLDEDDVPYCDVRGGRLPARFLPQAAFAVLDLLDPTTIRRVPRGAGGQRT